MASEKPLPVQGYRQITQAELDTVNATKWLEESVLRHLDELQVVAIREGYDGRWLAIARTQIEQGFMAANRAVMRPERITLSEDPNEPIS